MTSPLISIGKTGKKTPVSLTPTDMERVTQIARWHLVTSDYMARRELPLSVWNPYLSKAGSEESQKAYFYKHKAIRRRLWMLRNIQSVPAIGIGAPVSSLTLMQPADEVPGSTVAWYATRKGAELAGLKWDLRKKPTVHFARHARMAADIGLCIEKAGRLVLSEREHTSGWAIDGTFFDPDIFKSQYLGTKTEPDLVVPSEETEHFIAVEVERKHRRVDEYRTKFAAYAQNELVHKVWYIAETEAINTALLQARQRFLSPEQQDKIRVYKVKPIEGRYIADMRIQLLQTDLWELDRY